MDKISSNEIAKIRETLKWLQGQTNLLLGFIASSPKNLQDFANFTQAISESNAENILEVKAVALRLLAEGLSQYLSPPKPIAPTDKEAPRDPSFPNVIRFPKNP